MSHVDCSGSPQPRLRGKFALVTGGVRGIGRAIVELFLREGADVAVLDCDRDGGERLCREVCESGQGEVLFLSGDVACGDDLRQAAQAITAHAGRLDVLVNNAGIEIEKGIEEQTEEDWNRILDVNLKGPFLLCQQLLPLFPPRGGAIVNISSIHASHAFSGSIPYACSKAGMIALTRNLALELAPRGIRVNAICPGYIDTHLWEEYLRHAPNPEEVERATTALHPLGRRGLPQDVAAAALFLAEDASAFITGTQVVADGGLTIRAHP